MYDGDKATELPEITFERQLVDFLEINLTPFNEALDKLKTYTKENTSIEDFLKVMRAIGVLAESFCQDEPVYNFLLCTQFYAYSWEITDFDQLYAYKDYAIEMLRNMIHAQSFFFSVADAYCRYEGSHEEKVNKAFLGRERIFSFQLEQVIAHTDINTKMFQMTNPKLPYSRGFRLTIFPTTYGTSSFTQWSLM